MSKLVTTLLAAVFARVSPGRFFARVRGLIVTAFSTSSSSATLPTTMRVATEEFGVPDELYFEYRESVPGLEDLALYGTGSSTTRAEGRVDQLFLTRATPSFFTTLGAEALHGRLPTDEDGNRVVVIDTATDKIAATIPQKGYPDLVIMEPTGRHALVTKRWADLVSVIDLKTHTQVRTIPVGKAPHGMALRPR